MCVCAVFNTRNAFCLSARSSKTWKMSIKRRVKLLLNQANRNKNDFVFCFEYLRPVSACAIDDTGTSFFSASSYKDGFTKL